MKGEHSVEVLCELLNVSRSGYYQWLANRPTARQREDEALAEHIVTFFLQSATGAAGK